MYNVFYSWQSALPNKENRNLIEKAIKKGIEAIKDYSFMLDKDTKREPGSPVIVETIFKKIENCILYVCDVTPIIEESNRSYPNPNVLIELGYAVKTLGWDRIICVVNTKYSPIEKLPFNIRQNRILSYNSDNKSKAINVISEVIKSNLESVILNQHMYDEILDNTKMRIDYSILQIVGKFSSAFFNISTGTGAIKKFNETVDMAKEVITEYLEKNEFLAFYLISTFSKEKEMLDSIAKEIQSSEYFPKEWLVICLKLQKWIVGYNDTISKRFSPDIFKVISTDSQGLKVIEAKKLNPTNNGQILLNSENRVLNTNILSNEVEINPLSKVKINEKHIDTFSTIIEHLFILSREWLEITGNEIILDHRFFKIREKK